MKKVVTLFLVGVIILSFSACGNKKNEAFDLSQSIYNSITAATEIESQLSNDVYEAWRLGIDHKDEISIKYLADELDIPEEELTNGIVDCWMSVISDADKMTDDDKAYLVENASLFFAMSTDEPFETCVNVVIHTYIANGNISKVQGYLDDAKSSLKELSENHSDYEHYPALKDYYTTVSSAFSFCQDPTGSFEQMKTTINDYNNSIRDCKTSLDIIFEE